MYIPKVTKRMIQKKESKILMIPFPVVRCVPITRVKEKKNGDVYEDCTNRQRRGS